MLDYRGCAAGVLDYCKCAGLPAGVLQVCWITAGVLDYRQVCCRCAGLLQVCWIAGRCADDDDDDDDDEWLLNPRSDQ